MLDKEINFISDFCLNKVKTLGAFFNFEKLKKADIHPAVLQYISAHLDFLIFQDRKKLLEQSAFDYNGKEIAKYFALITEEVKKSKRLTFEDIKALIIKAASFNANYLISPKWTLSRLIFEGKDTLPVEEVKLMLNYSYYYDFLKNIFSAYLNKRHIYAIERDEFENLFDKIDKEVFSIQPKQFIENTLFDFADFFNIGGVSKTKLPLFAVEAFLKEKEMTDYLFRLKRALPLEPKAKYEIAELKTILLSNAPLDKQIILEAKAAEPEETEKPAAPPEIPLEETIIDFKKEEQNIDEMFEIHDDEIPDSEIPGSGDNENMLNSIEKVEDFLIANNEDTFNDIIDKIEAKSLQETEAEPEITASANEQAPAEDEFVYDTDKEENDNAEASPEPEVIEPDKFVENVVIKSEDIIAELMEDIKPDDTEENEEPETEKSEPILSEQDVKIETELPDMEPAISEKSTEEAILSLLNEIEGGGIETNIFEPEKKNTPEEENFITEKSFEPDQEESGSIAREISAEEDSVQKPPAIPDENAEAEPLIQKDITDYISEKDASKIISAVFKDDNVDFIITLGKISKCKTFEEGTDILKKVFAEYKVDPYSREAIKLTNIVAEYFNF
jgi:hypothetical protein